MHEFTNLEEHTTYSFRVTAFNSFGEGASNDPIEATTLEAGLFAYLTIIEVCVDIFVTVYARRYLFS